jgi:hypothetical protein
VLSIVGLVTTSPKDLDGPEPRVRVSRATHGRERVVHGASMAR